MAAILNFRSANVSETAEQISTKLARNVHWMVLYQIFVFGANLKSNMAARVHNVFSLAEILKIANGRTDGRRTLTHDKSSHGLWPGELKTGYIWSSKVKVPLTLFNV
jgi:hypothetical protein